MCGGMWREIISAKFTRSLTRCPQVVEPSDDSTINIIFIYNRLTLYNMPKRRAEIDLASPKTKREKPATDETKTNDSDRPEDLTPDRRADLLAKYPSLISSKLTDLDGQRFNTIPQAVIGRKDTPSGAHVTKDELVNLVEWKLKHGTFRPALLGMAKQHPTELVLETSKEAFALVDRDVIGALKVLTALRGIGPATASLILSCANNTTPFFSDELFRWVMWDEPGGGGWDRKIKYTEKEYRVFVEKVKGILEGLEDVSAYDLEKIAYVLARE